ncbi:hypothetical protein QYE76_003678 [Lolium multiflorum]|uniref:Uncharacterized protein n=1 Tax=Lolium multiflorum TaxID=4521 RepID=A0AAD8QHG4_LOLMU|nr:hypothetical protein QYE76_037535 [Lolium multiflorum]KAK1629363.1 hypothetical protein QYE76_003678 [Lolium multiflorum]
MYQWRKFEFFEEKAAGCGGAPAVPADIAGRMTFFSGARRRVAVGCEDGTVGLLDRGFQAYASSVLFLQQLKVHTGINSSGTAEFFHRFVVKSSLQLDPV